ERQAAALSRGFVVPGIPQEPKSAAEDPHPEPVPAAASLVTEQLPAQLQPSMEHMANLLEQAQLIARELRMPSAPVPLLHARPDTPITPEVPATPPTLKEDLPTETEEMEIDTILQTTDAESGPTTVPEAVTEPVADPAAPVRHETVVHDVENAPSGAAAPAAATMREANRLLSGSHFEEALQAFLELSHKS
ncbi:MAG: hypothetical protein ACYDHF_08470, partial [Candidatus Cryosericum sp.]